MTWSSGHADEVKSLVDRSIHVLAHDAMRDFLQASPPPFTGVVCFNDGVALGVLAALTQSGRNVPRDVSVVGFDDTLADLSFPPLTTVSHRFISMGIEATELVLEMVRNPDHRPDYRGWRRCLSPELVIRASTGAPRTS